MAGFISEQSSGMEIVIVLIPVTIDQLPLMTVKKACRFREPCHCISLTLPGSGAVEVDQDMMVEDFKNPEPQTAF